ncbi:MAG: hypothetical protein WC916_02030 [Candidatus Woesearchaeota archaeon]
MATTIQVSEKLLGELKRRKLQAKETYEDIIWNLIEDTLELSEETKRNIAQSEKDIAAGRIVTLEEVKKRLGMR